jgi:hypothetical protein
VEGCLRRRQRARRRFGLSALVLGLSSGAAQDVARPIDFARDVKPIFEVHCIACHGPKKQKGDYRLDTWERAIEGSPGGKTIVPGSPGASDFYRRLVTDDSELRMPQKEPPLDPRAIETIRRWIEQGARAVPRPTSEYWAFVPPVDPETPAVKDRAWIRNPVDRFVLARLEASGKPSAAEKPKADLFRRLRRDLTAVEATADEIAAFEKDSTPDAYEREVDRALGSQAFSERMAAAWTEIFRAPVPAEARGRLLGAFDEFARESIADDERRASEIWLGGVEPVALAGILGEPPKDRAGLARWIASSENPLFARVAVNRIWGLFFRKGLVEDFGARGDPPPEQPLLDWLALDFVGSGFSVRHVARRIVTSATYRSSALGTIR